MGYDAKASSARLADLDIEYPNLSSLIQATHTLSLEQLSVRQPAAGYGFYDLERLCADAKVVATYVGLPFVYQARQALGYLSVIDEYIAAGLPKTPDHFSKKKLLAPVTARPRPVLSSEFLDTMTECQWGMYFKDNGFHVEEEVPFPNGGDADFVTKKGGTETWIDCISPAPQDPKGSIEGWLAMISLRVVVEPRVFCDVNTGAYNCRCSKVSIPLHAFLTSTMESPVGMFCP